MGQERYKTQVVDNVIDYWRVLYLSKYGSTYLITQNFAGHVIVRSYWVQNCLPIV